MGAEISWSFIDGVLAGSGPSTGAAVFDRRGTILRHNQRWTELLKPIGNPDAQSLEEVFRPKYWKVVRSTVGAVLAGERSHGRVLLNLGNQHVRVRFYLVGEELYCLTLHQIDGSILPKARRWGALLELSREGFLILDLDGHIVEATSAVTEITGIPREELIGQEFYSSSFFRLLAPAGAEEVRERLDEILAGHRQQISGWVPYRRPDGTEGWLQGTIADHRADPVVGGIVVAFRDATREGLTFRDLSRAIRHANCAIWLGTVVRCPDGSLDWNLRFVDSQAAQRLVPLDLREGEDYLRAWYEARLEEDKRRTDQFGAQAILEGRRRYRQEFRCLDREGKLHWLQEDVYIEPLAENRFHLTGVCVDISDLKAVEERLSASERQLREVLATIRDAFWSYDVDDPNAIFLTDGVENLLGISKEAFLRDRGATYRYIHPEDAVNLRERLYRPSPDGINEHEFRVVRKDGEIRWIRARTYSQFDESGKLRRVAGLAWDVTEERQARESLQRQVQRQRAVLELTRLALSDAECDRIVERTVELVGEQTDAGYVGFYEALGEERRMLVRAAYFHPEVQEAGPLSWSAGAVPECVRSAGARLEQEQSTCWAEPQQDCSDPYRRCRRYPIAGPSGPFGWLVAISRVPAEPSGEEREFLATVAGVVSQAILLRQTLRKLQEARQTLEMRVLERTHELELLNRRLARSNADLQEFAYAASHDLQAPLRAIRQSLQLLERRIPVETNDQVQQFLQEAIRATERMSRLIDSLLIFSRVETHARPHQPVALNALLSDVLRDLKPLIQEAQAQIRAKPLPSVVGEPSQLYSLLTNLLSNAIKYRRPGVPPEIQIGCRESDAEYTVYVQDNGQGIPPEHHETIFHLFRRLHTDEEAAGSGMGLALCKRIVERHGGRIWVESTPSHGATFYFTLPKAGATGWIAEPPPAFP